MMSLEQRLARLESQNGRLWCALTIALAVAAAAWLDLPSLHLGNQARADEKMPPPAEKLVRAEAVEVVGPDGKVQCAIRGAATGPTFVLTSGEAKVGEIVMYSDKNSTAVAVSHAKNVISVGATARDGGWMAMRDPQSRVTWSAP